MDVCSKIFSRILCACSYKLLEKHGAKHQYGATPNCGCQDRNFTLKSILHLRQQHNQDTYVGFADLVKANDTYNHKLMLKILEQYGPPPKFRDSIKRLYANLKVVVKLGKEKAETDQEVGVRQGANLSSVIFLFLMSAFTEILEKEWKQSGLPEATFKNVTNASERQLTGHLKSGAKRALELIIHQILYIDAGAFFYERRKDAMLGLNLINCQSTGIHSGIIQFAA
jgi:hypothetical protein